MAVSNVIEVYEGNSLQVTCTVTGLDDLNGFVAYLTVYDSANVELFEIVGTINSLTITYDILNTQNQIATGNYVYEITIIDDSSSGPLTYTLRKDTYHIKKSNKFLP